MSILSFCVLLVAKNLLNIILNHSFNIMNTKCSHNTDVFSGVKVKSLQPSLTAQTQTHTNCFLSKFMSCHCFLHISFFYFSVWLTPLRFPDGWVLIFLTNLQLSVRTAGIGGGAGSHFNHFVIVLFFATCI